MRWIIIILVPLLSSLIGWFTNFLAVKMIFRPKKEINFLGLRIIGLIPRRRKELAKKIAETVEKELISHDDIKRVINSTEFNSKIISKIMKKVDSFIEQKFSANPLFAMFVSSDIVNTIKSLFEEELKIILPDVMEKGFEYIEDKLDFKEIVENKINAFELDKLENIVYSIASKELKAIEVFGGIVGFVIGVIQVVVISLV